MSFSVSHWSGRLGNNIQQIANCIMAAEKYKCTFRQKLDHDIIPKYDVNFEGLYASDWSGEGRYYSWQPLVHCEKGILEGGNETGLDVDYIFANMQRVCRDHIAPNLILPQKQTIGEDLPEGFQTSEFLLEKGFVDHIVSRDKMKFKISSLIDFLS